jgi:hypothetical protein
MNTMKPTTAMIAAAVSGIFLGAMGCADSTPPAASPDNPSSTMATPAATTPMPTAAAKHACKGQNECKGQGGCKTDKHACKAQNDCKGQGGCKSA